MSTSAESNVRVVAGDMFASDAQTLVNTVNTVGVMGKGVALEFKKRFPDMFEDYVDRCSRGEVRLGEPYLYRRLLPPFVLNFPTKDHWRSVSKLSDIVAGLEFLEQHHEDWGITSLAVPPLGCGHGGLEWRVVGPELYRQLARLRIPVVLYAPFGTPHEELTPEYLGRTPAEDVADGAESQAPSKVLATWVALVAALGRLERNPHRFYRRIGRTTFQKLAYFATEAGLPTNLAFTKGSYGPYASEMKGIQSKLVNNGLLVETPQGRMITYSVGPTFADARRAFEADIERWEPVTTAVAQLMARMSTRDAEVAATAHFAARQLQRERDEVPTEREVLEAVMDWKARKKPPLDEREVSAAIRNLAVLGWIEVTRSEDLPYEDLAEAMF
jgi:uncharacterized protein YwgA/O-acetyl-ADP-ribose deacetylase (regulator of RNase III)